MPKLKAMSRLITANSYSDFPEDFCAESVL